MLEEIRQRIADACRRAHRDPAEVRLVAVTKGHDAAEIRRRIVERGHLMLGESRIQEWRDKAEALADRPVAWHLIGRLQRNKVKYCRPFSLIHSLDSDRLADELDRQGERMGHVFDTLIQVNVSGEESKAGVPLARLAALVDHVSNLTRVRVHGLMTMAPHFDRPELARPVFAELREARDKLRLVDLSMGMSNDFEVAIEEGATIVRVGSALFEGETR